MNGHWYIGWLGARYSKDYDCAGLFAHVQRKQFGRDLAMPADGVLRPQFIRSAWGRQWAECGDPHDGDAALMRTSRGYHLGVVVRLEKGLSVLHNSSAGGAVLTPVGGMWRMGLKLERYYRWNNP